MALFFSVGASGNNIFACTKDVSWARCVDSIEGGLGFLLVGYLVVGVRQLG
jgi:hypothetical protein